jgi:hypothetical protein
MVKVVEKTCIQLLHARHRLERFEFGAYGGVTRFLEDALVPNFIWLAAKFNESIVKRPCIYGLQLSVQVLLENQGLVTAVERTSQPGKLGLVEALGASFQETAILVAPDFIDRPLEVLKYTKRSCAI